MTSQPSSRLPESITPDEFYESMGRLDPALPDRLRCFLEGLSRIGVKADFQRSLNLRWDPPSGRSINLGVIHRDGQVWTDAVNARAPLDLAHAYNEDLARRFRAEVDKTSFSKGAWHIRSNGKAPRIGDIANNLEAWTGAIQRFTDAVRARAAEHDA